MVGQRWMKIPQRIDQEEWRCQAESGPLLLPE
jgi:hypothetical protein